MDEVILLKIYSVENVSYYHTEASKFISDAQELAVKDAMATTQRLAQAGNIK